MINIKGSIPEKTLSYYRSLGTQGTPGTGLSDIPIATPNFKGNRKPKANVLSKYLKAMNGFHWGLFGAPLVARLPNGEMEIYDGGHRVAMLQMVDPDRQTFPGYVVPVADRAEISRLFHRINGSAASFVSAETRFINEVLGEETGTDPYLDVLNRAEIVVYESEDNFVPANVNPMWRLNVTPLKDITDLDPDYAVWAINLYKKAWGQHTNGSEIGISITGQIVKALHLLRNTYENDFAKSKVLSAFEKWFVDSVLVLPAKEAWIFNTEYKHDRMELRHYGTALGIMQRFCAWYRSQRGSKDCPIADTPKVSIIENLYRNYDMKKAKRLQDKISALSETDDELEEA